MLVIMIDLSSIDVEEIRHKKQADTQTTRYWLCELRHSEAYIQSRSQPKRDVTKFQINGEPSFESWKSCNEPTSIRLRAWNIQI